MKVVRSLISLKYLLISGCVNITDLGRPLIRARLAMWKIICNILYESGDFALAKSPLSPNPMLKEGLAHHKE